MGGREVSALESSPYQASPRIADSLDFGVERDEALGDDPDVIAQTFRDDVEVPTRGDTVFSNLLAQGRFHSPNLRGEAGINFRKARVDVAHTGVDLAHMEIEVAHASVDLAHMEIEVAHASVDLAHMGIDLAHAVTDASKIPANGSEFFFDLRIHERYRSNNPTIVRKAQTGAIGGVPG